MNPMIVEGYDVSGQENNMNDVDAYNILITQVKDGKVTDLEAVKVSLKALAEKLPKDPNYTGKGILKLQKAIDKYLSDINDNCSDKTYNSYTKKLRYFVDFYATRDTDSDPTTEDIKSYRDKLSETLKKSSIKTYLLNIHAFYEWAIEEELYESNPVTKKCYPKNRVKEEYSHILTIDELTKLWKNEPITTEKHWTKNYAITVLLLDSKIRNAELLDLRVSDIDLDNHDVYVRCGKGGKSRHVSITDISTSAIRLYLKDTTLSDDDYIFGVAGKRATESGLSAVVERHIRNVTGRSGFRSHSLRHAGAMIDLNSGVSKERIQQTLGHSSISTTEIYTQGMQSVKYCEQIKKVLTSRDYWASENARYLYGQI